MSVNDPHDKYFRAVMQHLQIARQFLEWFLPTTIKDILDWDSLELIDNTYVDESLNKSISDVVFNCRYKLKGDKHRQFHHSKIVILIEHQSSPERFMPIRVYNYLFSLLNRYGQNEDFLKTNKRLPAIYPMVFYNGKTKQYPYPMNVLECIENPMGIMHKFSLLDVQLININKLSQNEIEKHSLAGIMTEAMLRVPTKDHQTSYLSIFKRLSKFAQNITIPRSFTKLTVKYMMSVKSIENFKQLIETNLSLSDSIKGDIMTIAEQLEQRGILNNKIDVATTLLKKGMDYDFIIEVSKLELAKIKEIEAQLKQS